MRAKGSALVAPTVWRVDPALCLACTRWLSGHPPKSLRASLLELAGSAQEETSDFYGEGKVLEALTKRAVAISGKEDAIFVIKGTIAQQAMLRAHADHLGRDTVVVHADSHIARDEDRALEHVHNLTLVEVGQPNQAFTAIDLESLRKPPSSVVVELPLRRGDYALPSWDQLTAIAEWTRERGAVLHFDGARLWECQPYYSRPIEQLCALANTVYLSTYKILGGWSGALLAGPASDIERARVWLHRLGAHPRTTAPYALSATVGLDRHLPKIAGYVGRSRGLAATLQRLPGIRIAPLPPETNYFCVYFDASAQRLQEAAEHLARSGRVWLFAAFEASEAGARARTDVCIGESAEAWTDAEIAAAVSQLLDLARSKNRRFPASESCNG